MQLDLNLRAIILFYRECADLLRAAGAEHRNALVVNTSSISGKSGQAWLNVYSATKAAVIGWTQAMNKELNAEGIKSLALCPGFVDTPMTEFVREQVPPEEMIQTKDIAESVRFAAADLAVLHRPGDHLPAAGRARPVKLGIHIGYWGLGLDAAAAARARPGGRAARLRLRLDGRGVRLRRGHDPRLARGPDRAHQARLGDPADARPLAPR